MPASCLHEVLPQNIRVREVHLPEDLPASSYYRIQPKALVNKYQEVWKELPLSSSALHHNNTAQYSEQSVPFL